jgi:inner membrane protein
MDNLCHTLAGAAFAEAGLKQQTRFGSAALMIAANLPDIDVLSFISDTPAVALRRGWTHGILAQALLPVILTGVFLSLDTWRKLAVRQSRLGEPRSEAALRVRPLAMLTLGYVGVLSHVGMDWLNTYGVRLLMPVSRDWFYGDAVFIIDPWLWLTLAAGVWLARRRHLATPARWGLVLAGVYIVLMTMSARAARAQVVDAWTLAKGAPPARVMVGPTPINPLRKTIILDAGDYYERGTFDWWPTRVRFDPRHGAKNHRQPAAIAASQRDPNFRGLLIWSRFPYYQLHEAGDGTTRVTLADMRFGERALFTATAVVP